jgi:hypothetical protein
MRTVAATPFWVAEDVWEGAWDVYPDFFLPDHWVSLYLTTVDPSLSHLREKAEARLKSLPFSFAEVMEYLRDPEESLADYSMKNIMGPLATWADAATMATDRDLIALLILTGEWLKGHGVQVGVVDGTLGALRAEAAEMDRVMLEHAPRIRELLDFDPPWELKGRMHYLLPDLRRLTAPSPRGPWASIVLYPI